MRKFIRTKKKITSFWVSRMKLTRHYCSLIADKSFKIDRRFSIVMNEANFCLIWNKVNPLKVKFANEKCLKQKHTFRSQDHQESRESNQRQSIREIQKKKWRVEDGRRLPTDKNEIMLFKERKEKQKTTKMNVKILGTLRK